jgi:hypothetical protein
VRFLILAALSGCQLIVGTDDPEALVLDRLQVTGAQLQPAFDPEITSYTAVLSHADTVMIRPHSPDPDVMMRIGAMTMPNDALHTLPVQSGSNLFAIEVSTQQGVTRTYNVDVQVPGARLKAPVMHGLTGMSNSVKSIDLTGDGTPDLAVCSNIGVTTFDGKTFGPIFTIGATAPCVDFAIGDLDGVNGPDIVAVTNATKATVTLNVGNATFAQQTQVGNGLHFISVALGDIDNDGELDLMLGDDQNGPPNGGIQQWMFGDGSGTFGTPTQPDLAAGSRPSVTLLGDFDPQAGTDAMVLAERGSAITLLKGDNTGAFVLHGATDTFEGATPTQPRALVATSLDDVAVPDYVLVHEDRSELRIITNFHGVDTNVQDVVATTLSTDMAPRAVIPADLDGDGHQDFVVPCHNTSTFQVFYGDGAGNYVPMRYVVPTATPAGAAVADFDGDGLLDVVIIDDAAPQMFVFLQEPRA